MTIQELDSKYSFNRKRACEMSGMSYDTVMKFFKGQPATVKTAAAIINALPITAKERRELIDSMFERKGN